MLESALEWQLRLIKWEFFVTLTFDPHRLGTPTTRLEKAMRWLGEWCASAKVDPDDIDLALRGERGECGGWPHFHMLVGRFPANSINLTTCFQQGWRWNHRWSFDHETSCTGCRYGIGQVRLYDPSRNGEAYMTKGRFSAEWAKGANNYERAKFDSADFVYLNPRALLSMEESRTIGRRMLPLLREAV